MVCRRPSLSRETHSYPAAQFSPRPNPEIMATRDEVLEAVGEADTVVLDVRSDEEWTGENKRGTKRGGRIPGAVHLEWTNLLTERTCLVLLPADELRRIWRPRNHTGQECHHVLTGRHPCGARVLGPEAPRLPKRQGLRRLVARVGRRSQLSDRERSVNSVGRPARESTTQRSGITKQRLTDFQAVSKTGNYPCPQFCWGVCQEEPLSRYTLTAAVALLAVVLAAAVVGTARRIHRLHRLHFNSGANSREDRNGHDS